MSPSIVERTTIHWPDQDQRFYGHGPVISLPLEMASPPPADPSPKAERAYESVRWVYAVKMKKAPKHSRAGRPSSTHRQNCPEGGKHEWRSSGRLQWRCPNCKRTIMKTLMPLVVADVKEQTK